MHLQRLNLPWLKITGSPQKTLRVMKLTAILLLAVSLQVAAKTYSQTVSLSLKDAPLETVLQEIKKQTGYLFFYNLKWLQKTENVNIRVKNVPIKEALDNVFQNQEITYTIIGKTIVLKLKAKPNKLIISEVPQLQIRGRIVNESGEPLEGASVIVKGSNNGTISNNEGGFNIEVNEGEILIFSMVGFMSFEQRVYKGTSFLQIELQSNITNNKNIVVVGYGSQKKISLTGSVTAINSKDLQGRPITSTSSALQGLLPGVTVINASGKPGGGNSTIRIRGVGTFNNPNPLTLIDGLEGDIDLLNPEDIESISVLKDAASGAIYGSRAANGVILVTTKKGSTRLKQPLVSYSGYSGFQKPTRMQKYLGSAEFMEFQNEALTNVGRPTTFTAAQIQAAKDGTDPDFFSNTNWLDQVFEKNAFQQNQTASVNGGNEKSSYYLSYGYLDQRGLIIENATGLKRHNVRLRLNTTVLEVVDLDANLGYVDRKQTDPAIGLAGNTGLIYSAHEMTPLVPVRFKNGGWGYGGTVYNPVSTATDGGRNQFDAQDITGNISATLKLSKDLRLKGLYGLVNTNSTNNILTRKISYFSPVNGAFFTSNVANNKIESREFSNRYQNLSAQLDYKHKWGKHDLQGLLGFSQEWNRTDFFTASREGLLNDMLPVIGIATGTQAVTGTAGHWAIRSFFSRLNYNYAEKYLLELNMRTDGSSRFAENHRWGTFPSVSAGWRISEEKFMRPFTSVINEMKLRASWGSLGNDKLLSQGSATSNGALYPYVGTFNSGRSMPVNLGAIQTDGFQQNVLGNAIVTWEKVNMANIGLDVQLLRNRLSFTGDYFVKTTKGILLTVLLPDVLGMNEPPQNVGAVENKGWEISVGWRDQKGGFRYSLLATVADVKNRITDLGGVGPSLGDQVRFLNYPIDAFYGLVVDRIAQESDFTKNSLGQYVPKFAVIRGDSVNIRPGDLIYKDLNGDNSISLDKDRQVIGNPFPRYTYTLRGDLAWKNIDFSFFTQGVGKANGYVSGNGRHAFYNEASFPQEMHRNRWTPNNTTGTYPRFTYLQNHNRYLSTFWLENAAYFRLKNVQLGYTVPTANLFRGHVQKLRLYVSADNLFTKTKFLESYDPEVPVGDGGLYPQVKTFVFGVNLMLK